MVKHKCILALVIAAIIITIYYMVSSKSEQLNAINFTEWNKLNYLPLMHKQYGGVRYMRHPENVPIWVV
jgi:hypothetical protein